jgi:predicted nucleotidyltransferase
MNDLKTKTKEELEIILKELLERVSPLFGDKLKKAILFGSYARGDYDAESDIDVMLMLSGDEATFKEYSDKITDIIVDLDLKYDVVLAALLQSESKFLKYRDALPFYSSISREGVVLYEQ